jgi:hypothetical protein
LVDTGPKLRCLVKLVSAIITARLLGFDFQSLTSGEQPYKKEPCVDQEVDKLLGVLVLIFPSLSGANYESERSSISTT